MFKQFSEPKKLDFPNLTADEVLVIDKQTSNGKSFENTGSSDTCLLKTENPHELESIITNFDQKDIEKDPENHEKSSKSMNSPTNSSEVGSDFLEEMKFSSKIFLSNSVSNFSNMCDSSIAIRQIVDYYYDSEDESANELHNEDNYLMMGDQDSDVEFLGSSRKDGGIFVKKK